MSQEEPMDRVSGHATAFVLQNAPFGTIFNLRIVDETSPRLQAVSDAPVPSGAAISIGFAEVGRVARRGVVERCLRGPEGWVLEVRYEGRLAA